MNLALKVTQEQLADVLLHVAPVRPVFIWGAPGIGKSSLVRQFADAVEVKRQHAWLLPQGCALPFRDRGRVFRFQ